MLIVSNLSLNPRLLPLSFEAKQGEIIHLIGANGSGKTTLLSLLSGLCRGNGDIVFDGKNILELNSHQLACQRAYLIQQQKPAFVMQVYQYLYLCMQAHKACYRLEEKRLEAILLSICRQLNIADKLQRSITELSGGEWQRVRLAGVWLQISKELNSQAKMLLLDEPATGLDIAQQEHLSSMVKSIAQQGITVIMSSHDLNRSLNEASKLVLLKKGHCLDVGTPQKLIQTSLLDEVFGIELNRLEINGKFFILPC